MKVYYETKPDELMHYGVLGMKWGKRKNDYRSISIKAAIARKQNEKVDKSFKKWDERTNKKQTAIDLGKKANIAKIAYEKDRSNADLKKTYKTANKEYKKALGKNTTYHKGVIRQEVGRDISRKYLSEAKKIKKQMVNNPSNKDLQKKYAGLMSAHDIERAKARRAIEVGAKRSNKKASIKRGMTLTLKAAAATTAIAAGVYAVNKTMEKRQVTLNGKRIYVRNSNVKDVLGAVKNINDIRKYFY